MGAAASVIGVILAGGRARRAGGGDKCLLPLAGKPILYHLLERMRPQLEDIVINASGDPKRFGAWGLPVVADVVEGTRGPLAGVLSGMEWAVRHRPGATNIVTLPGDGPFPPRDLVQRLLATREAKGTQIVRAASGGQAYPVVALWPISLAPELRRAILEEKAAKVEEWAARYSVATEAFECQTLDPFFNVNTPQELAEAERLMALAGELSGR